MNLLQELEQEVDQIADQMSDEILRRLLEKWDIETLQSLSEHLRTYVVEKIRLQRMRRCLDQFDGEYWERCGKPTINRDGLSKRIIDQSLLVRGLRQKYYAAKKVLEGEHNLNCQCRGCKCLSGFNLIEQ